MKLLNSIVLGFIAMASCKPVFASDYNYDVSGRGDGGDVHGDVNAYRGSKDVDGTLYREDGSEVNFDGEWTGHGQIEGYDEDGNYIELEVD